MLSTKVLRTTYIYSSAYLVSNALTFSLLVVKEDTNGDISSKVHFSLAQKRTDNLSPTLTGRSLSVNLRITGGSLSSTKTNPASWDILVVIPSGTAFCHISRNSFKL